jgi:hypothetical protein
MGKAVIADYLCTPVSSTAALNSHQRSTRKNRNIIIAADINFVIVWKPLLVVLILIEISFQQVLVLTG